MRSIGLRRITGGCLAAVTLLNNACNDATSQAEKVVEMIKSTLKTQSKTTTASAVDTNVRQIGQPVKGLGMFGA